jgi:hypothetical protein
LISYMPFFSPVGGLGAISTSLTRQLSPDGTQLLLTGNFARRTGTVGGLVAITLATGEVAMVVPSGAAVPLEAAWSSDGKRIAYLTASPASGDSGRELWIANANGTAAQRLLDSQSGIGHLYGFSSDGAWVCFSATEQPASSTSERFRCLHLVDRRTEQFAGVPNGAGIQGDWRNASPSFVGTLRDASGPHVDVADGVASGQRHLADVNCSDPRWRPQLDDVLCRGSRELYLVNRSGAARPLTVSMFPRAAAWLSQDVIAFVATESLVDPGPLAPRPVSSLRTITALGTDERELFRAPREGFGLTDLAVHNYR